MNARDRYPQRIVCLTEETTETLYALGEDRRIVGISGFTVRPPRARKEKPKVSAFTSAKIDRIVALQPDLVLGFSDLQADIARELVSLGVDVHVYNHRSVEGIFGMILTLGGLVGCERRARRYVDELERGLDAIRERAAQSSRRPRVYFEEWDDPHISCIRWVSELIAIAGGDDIFPELALQSLGKDRIIADGAEIVARDPQIIIGSWCGKKFRAGLVREREGWAEVSAVRAGELHEVKSAIILQPGPAALTDGVTALSEIIGAWAQRH